ncbi:TetR/AcrR family transcriptional regulator [Burkholderia sp. IMCC1007]|uniref:TetR/AcrR family transcriptional regulator n=1 Tax=Burkholderia sp. IMCC1007 TaxID=3004104 RepID=UPI0022B5BF74|nr:helix-turn-helix domain-containing protein [Burkholderia sp. IMCC1007]
MDPGRPTHAQRRDATRERLIGAARAIFAEKGYAAASVEDIAAAAGHTRGAFYSNFRSKTEMLFELLTRDHDDAGVALPLPAQVLALGLTALCDGVQSCCAADACSTADALADAVLVGFVTHTVFGGARG